MLFQLNPSSSMIINRARLTSAAGETRDRVNDTNARRSSLVRLKTDCMLHIVLLKSMLHNTSLNRELSGKRLELFNEVVPRISRVGILTDATSTTGSSTGLEEYEAAARAIKMPLQSLKVRGPSPDLEDVFRAAVKARVSALISVRTGVLLPYTKTIADLAIKNRLPLMFEGNGLVESYSPNDTEFHRRAATYVDKILKGAKPADLPVEQPMKFEFVINLKTAKQIGLTIPQTVLYRADRVIK